MDFFYRRMYCGPLQAVVLDLAGTTVDYGCCAPVGAFMETFKQRQITITMAQARAPMGMGKKDHIRTIAQMEPIAQQWVETHGRSCTEDDIEAMFRDFEPMQAAIVNDYADLIPGTLDMLAHFRERGLSVGISTGYSQEIMDVLVPTVQARGFAPDSIVCMSDVPAGRPSPFMCFQNAMNLGCYPMEALVKIGDTIPDVEEGLNAGMWTIGVTKSGNELGLTEAEIAALEPADLSNRLRCAHQRLAQAGAHYVVESIADVPPILDAIEARLRQGERP
jgi:phosphonoacetaldehyde hydrolase